MKQPFEILRDIASLELDLVFTPMRPTHVTPEEWKRFNRVMLDLRKYMESQRPEKPLTEGDGK